MIFGLKGQKRSKNISSTRLNKTEETKSSMTTIYWQRKPTAIVQQERSVQFAATTIFLRPRAQVMLGKPYFLPDIQASTVQMGMEADDC